MKESDKDIDQNKEIKIWRRYFLDQMFSGAFKFIPANDKNIISGYFLCIPSCEFTDPREEWNKCLSCLLQQKEDKKQK